MAAHRMNRTFLPPADANPLAPAKPGAVYQDGEIPAEDYDVVVFENRFPSLLAVPGIPDAPVQRDGEPLWTVRPAAGRCEVICFSADSTASLSTVTPRRMRTIVEAWTQRTEALSALPGIEQVFVFENRGKEIGVTLHHPHGQIYAFPYVTPRTTAMLTAGPRAPRADRPPAGPGRPGRRAGARRTDRPGVRALGGVRAVRGALARRGAPGPPTRRPRPAGTHRRGARRPVDRLPGAAAAAGPVLRRPRRRAHPPAVHLRLAPGARPARAGTSPACTSSCSRCCVHRASSSTSPASSPAWAPGSATPPPSASRPDCRSWHDRRRDLAGPLDPAGGRGPRPRPLRGPVRGRARRHLVGTRPREPHR